jgi:hypothetical protein
MSNTTSQNNLSIYDRKYMDWAALVVPFLEIKFPNTDTMDENDYAPHVENQLRNWYDEECGVIFEELFEKATESSSPNESSFISVLAGYIGRLEGEYFNNGLDNIGNGQFCSWVDEIEGFVLKKDRWTEKVINQIRRDCYVLRGGASSDQNIDGIFTDEAFEDSLFRIQFIFTLMCKED